MSVGSMPIRTVATAIGYSVFLQHLTSQGVEKFKHGGIEVAHLSNSSTEDYGLDIDTAGNALLAFLDTREGSNQQVTAAKMAPGEKLCGDVAEFSSPRARRIAMHRRKSRAPAMAGS